MYFRPQSKNSLYSWSLRGRPLEPKHGRRRPGLEPVADLGAAGVDSSTVHS